MTLSKDLTDKLDLLDKYDGAYYNSKPLVPDKKYDLLKDYIYRQLPPDDPRLNKVGHVPVSNWPKETHSIFMGSQNKVTSEIEIETYMKKVHADLGKKDGEVMWILQYKIDGFSLATKYLGRLEKGITRGNGTIGENITENVKLFRHVPNVLSIDKEVVVRGEGVIALKDFDAIQKIKTGEPYKNPRNAAAGIARKYDGK